jgi:hypothetical protein
MDHNAFVGHCCSTERSMIDVCWEISVILNIVVLGMG